MYFINFLIKMGNYIENKMDTANSNQTFIQ